MRRRSGTIARTLIVASTLSSAKASSQPVNNIYIHQIIIYQKGRSQVTNSREETEEKQ
jgi:hypothetical protein